MAKIALFKAGNLETASGPKASISVPNDGRVTFLVIGAGTGRWRAHVAFAEVLDGVVLRRWDAFATDAEPIVSLLLDSNNGTLAGWLVEGDGKFAVGGFADAAEGAAAIAMHDMGAFSGAVDLESTPKAYLAFGARASVAGVQYTYGAGGWVEQVDGVECFETVNERNLAYPTAPKAGTEVGIRRLCGNGYFYQRYNGTRWESFGSIILDAGAESAGYPLIAVSTAFVALASYVIPAGLIGNGEQWGSVHFAENTGVLAGTDAYQVRIANNQIACVSNYTFANRRTTATGNIVRTGSSIICLSAGSLSGLDVNNYPGGLQATDLAASQTISIGVTPGAAGNTLKINQWSFRRIA